MMDTMDLLVKDFKLSSGSGSLERGDHDLVAVNSTAGITVFQAPEIDVKGRLFCKVEFYGETIEGNSGVLWFFNQQDCVAQLHLNSTIVFECRDAEALRPELRLLPNSGLVASKIEVSFFEDRAQYEDFMLSEFTARHLIVTPNYPAEENKYLCGFVHSRVKAYAESGQAFDVAVVHNYSGFCKYTFEGVEVLQMGFSGLRLLLQRKAYDVIAVHFFDEKYARVFDACDLSSTRLFLWAHGVETLYRDWPKFATGYFRQERKPSEKQVKRFGMLDELIARYNDMDNVTWVFVSEWIRIRSEQLIGIEFRNYREIPNFIDSDVYRFQEKPVELRKKVFFVRRFDDIAKYAIDVNIRTILELSRRPCFKDMEFFIYGAGTRHGELVKPVRRFKNVHIHEKFLQHDEIAAVHRECGIALFDTRYDAQGVSMCEAAMSGLAVVSSDMDVCKLFLPDDQGLLADCEDYVGLADNIERLYDDPDAFRLASKACHEKVERLCSFDQTIRREIDMLFNDRNRIETISPRFVKRAEGQPVLTIAIPSYNAQDCLKIAVDSVMQQSHADLLDVIIVNDGSHDDTLQVATRLAEMYNEPGGDPIIRVIDKENGGHGSGINVGIEQARGVYFRILDADDRMVSSELEKLLEVLVREDSDIVLTDYAEDQVLSNRLVPRRLYDFMAVGHPYVFEDLCYPGYGFKKWGPLLATGSFKTAMLRETGFKLTEKCFYVDMEFDMYSIVNAHTVSHYPFDVYRYVIGDDGQSISKQSFIRNYKQHERVIINLADYVEKNKSSLSPQKRKYIIDKLIAPMAKSQYMIVLSWMESEEAFRSFDSKLSRYPDLYEYKGVGSGKLMDFHRKTNGRFASKHHLLVEAKDFSKAAKARTKGILPGVKHP